ncbi:MAG: prephenate dehydratase [Ignavibacteriae bacterium]|nr:prephenate dehydratase [Ignavibacteriota bacterium]
MKYPVVAFQGEYGAFSEQAANGFFSRPVKKIPLKSFEEVFECVHRKKADFGVIPIENSLYGSVHQNYDLLEKYHLHIIGEIKLRVVHALLVNKGVTLQQVKYIYSHPQALGQCKDFLSRLNHVEVIAAYDTAGAAKAIKEDRRDDAAAIASLEAARAYGLKVLRRGIESNHENYTRFLLISKKKRVATKHAKTSIIFSMENVPGALFRALSVFALRDIDLYKIESRPIIGKPWEYLFYLDFQGSIKDEPCRNAIAHLREITTYLKILGSYQTGKTMTQ